MIGAGWQGAELHLFAVAFAAGLGALVRAGVDRGIVGRFGVTRLPWATLAVNIAGSLLLGVVLGLEGAQAAWSGGFADGEATRTIQLVVGTGFCGGLTTFSTFSYESFLLMSQGRGGAGVAYVAITILTGLAAIALGTALGTALATGPGTALGTALGIAARAALGAG